ncbi:MAG: hypothetical protein AAGJ34_12925 [Pseudomonadota bacterium]
MLTSHLKKDMERFGLSLSPSESQKVEGNLKPICEGAGVLLLSQTRVADRLIYITSGIAASVQTWNDGKTTIARFFEPNDLCTNVTSAWTGDISSDDLVAITDIKGLSIPLEFYKHEYVHGDAFGKYLRYRMMEAHLFAKELVCAKTQGRTHVRYQFLETHHKEVLALAPKQDVAKFLGLTPQSYSRFLRTKDTNVATSVPNLSVNPTKI